MRYSDDIIEEVRMKNDIVDVISQYVKLTRRGSSYLGCVPSIMRKPLPFPVTTIQDRCITALAAELEEMFLPL